MKPISLPQRPSVPVLADLLCLSSVEMYDAALVSLRVWRPDDEAKALYEGAIVAAVQSNELVAVGDAEMLPSHVLLLHGVIVELVPEFVN